MFITISPLTLFLAKVLGVYMVAAGLSGLTMKTRWSRILSDMRDNAALSYISGIFIFAVGCGIIGVHNFWTDPLAAIVSFIGWGAILEGLLFIVLPGPFLKFSAGLLRPGAVPLISGISVLMGCALIFAGVMGVAG